MIVNVVPDQHYVEVSIGGASAELERFKNESQLLHHVKLELIKQGYDVVKREMVKDGHLVSEGVHYIRDRKGKFAIWNGDYQVVDAAKYWNKHNHVFLDYVND